MYQIVNEHDFIDAFRQFDRLDTGDNNGGNFTPAGCRALFDHLQEFEESIGEPIELDVVALCCEYAEHGSLKSLAGEYEDSHLDSLVRQHAEARGNADFVEADLVRQEFLDWFRDQTTVIEVDGGDIIIQAF